MTFDGLQHLECGILNYGQKLGEFRIPQRRVSKVHSIPVHHIIFTHSLFFRPNDALSLLVFRFVSSSLIIIGVRK
jgi:hypothetical protein